MPECACCCARCWKPPFCDPIVVHSGRALHSAAVNMIADRCHERRSLQPALRRLPSSLHIQSQNMIIASLNVLVPINQLRNFKRICSGLVSVLKFEFEVPTPVSSLTCEFPLYSLFSSPVENAGTLHMEALYLNQLFSQPKQSRATLYYS
jgi:hypothetical protein